MSRLSRAAAVAAVSGLTIAFAGCAGALAAAPKASSKKMSPGVASAQAAVNAAMKRPVGITRTPLTKRPPRGKSIVYVSCPVQTCTAVQAGLEVGVKALGWKLTVIQGGIDPQTQNAGWTQAVQDKPAGIVGITTVPYAALSGPLAAAKAAKIPIVTIAGSGAPIESIISNLVSPTAEAPIGKLMAQWAIADSKGKANAVLFNDPSNPSFNAVKGAFQHEFASACPACKLQVETYSTLNIGKSVPGQVVSYVQQNPSVKYVGFTLDSAALGVPQALAAAGLGGKVKLFGRAAVPPNTVDISKGLETMGVGEELTSLSWEALDSLARKFVGDPTKAYALPPVVHQLITKANIQTALSNPAAVWQVPNVPRTFEKLWHLR